MIVSLSSCISAFMEGKVWVGVGLGVGRDDTRVHGHTHSYIDMTFRFLHNRDIADIWK